MELSKCLFTATLLLIQLTSRPLWAADQAQTQRTQPKHKVRVFNHFVKYGEIQKDGDSCFAVQYDNFKSWKLPLWYRSRLVLDPGKIDLAAGKREHWSKKPDAKVQIPPSLKKYAVKISEVPLSKSETDSMDACLKSSKVKDLIFFAKYADSYVLENYYFDFEFQKFIQKNKDALQLALLEAAKTDKYDVEDIKKAQQVFSTDEMRYNASKNQFSFFADFMSHKRSQEQKKFSKAPFKLVANLTEPIPRPVLIAVEHRSADRRKNTAAALDTLVKNSKLIGQDVIFLLSDIDMSNKWIGKDRLPNLAFFSVNGEHNLMISHPDITFSGGSANANLGVAIREAITRHFLVTERKLRIHLPLQAIYTDSRSFAETNIDPQEGTLLEILNLPSGEGGMENLIDLSGIRNSPATETTEAFNMSDYQVRYYLDQKPHLMTYGVGHKVIEVYFWTTNSWPMIDPYGDVTPKK